MVRIEDLVLGAVISIDLPVLTTCREMLSSPVNHSADYVEPPSVKICGVVLGDVHKHYVWRNTAWTKCPRGSWVILTHLFLSFGMGHFDPYHVLFRFVPSWHEVKNKKSRYKTARQNRGSGYPKFFVLAM